MLSIKRGFMKKVETVKDCDNKIKKIKAFSIASKIFFWVTTIALVTLAILSNPLPGTIFFAVLTGLNCGIAAQGNLEKLTKKYMARKDEIIEEERFSQNDEYKYQDVEVSKEEIDFLKDEKKSKVKNGKKTKVSKDEDIDDKTF